MSYVVPRTLVNRGGVSYDATKTSVIFAEDMNKLKDNDAYLKSAVEAIIIPAVRQMLTANLTLYVRTDGNDTNNGLANTSGGAFLTIQKAIDFVASLDCSIYNVTIQVGDGTYTSSFTLKSFIGSGIVTIQGNITTPTNCIVTTSANVVTANNVQGIYNVKGFKFIFTNGTAFRCSGAPTYVAFANIYFSASGGVAVMSWGFGCKVEAIGPFTLAGSYWTGLYALEGGLIVVTGNTVTCITGLSFSANFAFCERALACIDIFSMTFVGTATGSRYTSQNNSVIFTNGGGATYLPGSVAGGVINGGLYV